MTRLIVHIGYPKCASTTLQEIVFPSILGERHFGIARHNGRRKDQWRFLYNILFPDGNLSTLPPELRLTGCQKSDDISAKSVNDPLDWLNDGALSKMLTPGAVNVFSAEQFLFPYRSQFRHNGGERLKRLFDDGSVTFTVLIIIRNQADLVTSYVAEKWHYLSQSRLITSPAELLSKAGKKHTEYIDNWDFSKTVETWENVFGEGSVKILLYEDLAYDSQKFYKELSKIIDCDEKSINESLKGGKEERKRKRYDKGYLIRQSMFDILNMYLPHLSEPCKKSPSPVLIDCINRIMKRIRIMDKKIPFLDKEEKQDIRRMYSESNAELIKKGVSKECLIKYNYI